MTYKKCFVGAIALACLSACNNTDNNGTASQNKELISSVTHEGTSIQGGTLKYAIINDSPISGILNSVFYQNSVDSEVIDFFDESLFSNDDQLKITDSGIGKLTYDIEKKTITVTIKENIKWSDGQPLTIDDYIFAFEVIGHKEYQGLRYDSNMKMIDGMAEYHEGITPTISGITKNNDYSVTFQVKELSADVIQAGGFWANPMPKHIFGQMEVKDMAASDAVRKNPVGLGAFKVKSVVSGESVILEANPYYWKGKPKIENVVIEVVNINNAASEFASGNYDIMAVPTSKEYYDAFAKLKNATILGYWSDAISYLGFKVGKWDATSENVIFDKESKMANKSLRQAMGYALDLDSFATSFYDVLQKRANSLITPNFNGFYDSKLEGYVYNVEKATKLLDEAGYKDIDGDGLREDPNGKKLTINFAFMSGGNGEAQAQYYIQQWKAVGLDVQLTNGRLLEFNSFYDLVENDDPAIDVYSAAWSIGGNPNPETLWGNNPNNYTRFVSSEHDDILKKFSTEDMFDTEKQKEAYQKWQAYANEEAFAIPTLFRVSLTAVNKRVKSLNISVDETNYKYNLHKLELTATEPLK
ncbi:MULTISPECIES: oligopeptide ABC transporter substrate-binding protein [unclassified Granulicatella]|uniref:oligopeptide ABC transporter substrate-binding protein n=1 Tax=unclassified Granulicatella TaxID=2630493 RepID=UPI00143085BE|nr:oligopeptide ABC transporter substrate-binding protein [Granulicatella sp. WM01]MBF0779741.1 oligopeptide ABC transporter substrate-binding protein [Granulicatella sp. 19428wC4_WM01]